jgi:hypothetical protein
LVLHIIQENVYLSVEFTSWSSGNGGNDGGEGGFSYRRSTNTVTNLNEKVNQKKITFFPNPTVDFIRTTGIKNTVNYEIYDLIGSKITGGVVSNNEKIDVKNYKNGVYFIKLKTGQIIRFVKK